MKKFSQLITGTIILGTMFGLGGQSYAATQEINGDGTEATVKVEATIGPFDNTTPGPDPENTDMWINVTVPITVLFHSTENDMTVVESPIYQVTNNSARGVGVDVAPITNPTDIGSLDSLNINSIKLIIDGSVTIEKAQTLFILGDNAVIDGSNVGTFSFTGEVDSGLIVEENPGFDMMLKFTPMAAE
ncbi:hypothetical protein ACOJIU_18375 (plasmid) [Carnobacterium maltaromaticum]|uniref:hypothetical protein n=1 Tax=Carnobacterium maltaromaticum TaxID=2751 RepID=UPI00344CE139